MTPSGAPVRGFAGPAALRWIRELSGLTQHGLAQRSGVSERTIRGLELGQVRAPHRASLEALAHAAELDDHTRRTFLRAWAPNRVSSWSELTRAYAPLSELRAELALQAVVEQHLLSGWTEHRVLTNGGQELQSHHLVEAQHDGVRVISYPIFPEGGDVEVRVLGAEVSGCHHFRESGLVVYEIELPSTLRHGETTAFSTEYVRNSPPPPSHGGTDWYLTVHQRAVPVHVLRTTFEGSPPDVVWQVEISGGEKRRRIRTVTPDAYGRVVQVNRYRRPGAYGFEWTYPIEGSRPRSGGA